MTTRTRLTTIALIDSKDRKFCLSGSPLTAALESRNNKQTTTDRNQVLEQSNVEIWLVQKPHESSAGVIAGKTTDDSPDQSQPSTDESRLSTAKRNAGAREATGHD